MYVLNDNSYVISCKQFVVYQDAQTKIAGVVLGNSNANSLP